MEPQQLERVLHIDTQSTTKCFDFKIVGRGKYCMYILWKLYKCGHYSEGRMEGGGGERVREGGRREGGRKRGREWEGESVRERE